MTYPHVAIDVELERKLAKIRNDMVARFLQPDDGKELPLALSKRVISESDACRNALADRYNEECAS
jgi:hypothetical protein